MAAPVHRFTAVATVEGPPRRPHRSTQNHYPRTPNPNPPVAAATRRQADELYVEIPSTPPQPTIASLAAARSVTPDTLLRTAALGLHHSPMMAPHLKFGMLVSFAIATVFLAGAKYYFDRQVVRGGVTGGEAGVVCVMASVAGVTCVWCACRRSSTQTQLLQPDRVSSTARRQFQSTDTSEQASVTSPAPVSAPTTETTPEAPPPYHIAVLLPPREAPSPPPPAYSALS